METHFWLGDEAPTSDNPYRLLRNRAAEMGYACVGEALDALDTLRARYDPFLALADRIVSR